MATRQSLPLLGMGPELQPFHDKCFICQSDIDIQSIKRCHVMPCCGKFLHKRCFRKARETSFQCGHCRVEGEGETSNSTDSIENELRDVLRANETLEDSDENPVWVTPPELHGPTLIERARNDIADLRSSGFAHSHHQPGTTSWQRLPYPIDPMTWYLFWVNMDWFISTSPEEPRPLYVHTNVYTPVDPEQSMRKVVYRLITELFPATVHACLTHVKYRLRFMPAGDNGAEAFPYPYNPHEVTFTHIRFTRFWSPVLYYEDFPYTTSIPPNPPTPPEPRTLNKKCVFAKPRGLSLISAHFRFVDVTSGF